MSAEAPLGTFEEQVMVAVLRTSGEAHGSRVRQEIERAAERDVAIGAVYATLDRLEAKGLVASRRVGVGSASRRCFAITRAGARVLVETRAMRERLWRGVRVAQLVALGGG